MFTLKDVAKKVYEKNPDSFSSEAEVYRCLEVYFKWIQTCVTSDRFYDVEFHKFGMFIMKKELRTFYGTEERLIKLRESKTNVTQPKLLLDPGQRYVKHKKHAVR